MTRDKEGKLWFNVGATTIPSHGGLARLDPKTATMSGTGGAVMIDVDGKG